MSSDSPPAGRLLPFVSRDGLTFGIYHGGVVESHHELATGKPDAPDEVNRALDRLQNGKQLLVRTYLRFTGTEADAALDDMPGMADLARYTWNGRKLDLVLSNWDPAGDMHLWGAFVERAVERYGEYVRNFQICEEPNLFDYPGDGRFGHSVEAVVAGVRVARAALRRRGLKALVGFNAVPTTLLHDGFWTKLAPHMNRPFLELVDYVGLNLYVDVSEPLVGDVEVAVEQTLTDFRQVVLAKAGIPLSVPVHVSENGWPTGPHRYYTRQAEMLQRIVERVHSLRKSLNITQFALYSLRDADTSNPDVGHQFGIMRDDYSPKPAFETYQRLIQDFGN